MAQNKYLDGAGVAQLWGATKTYVGESIEDKADIDGYYSQLTAGLAENLIGRGDAVPAEYLYRTAGGTDDIEDGIATLRSIKGNTLVWNQLVKTPYHSAAVTDWNGVTVSVDNNNYVTASGTASRAGTWGFCTEALCSLIAGHKMLLRGIDVLSGAVSFRIYSSDTATTHKSKVTTTDEIFTINTTSTKLSVYIMASTSSEMSFSGRPQLFDLTLMFGAGNEPETVEEFEAMFPLPYYPYSAPKMLPVDMRGIETVGFNAYDPSTGEAELLGGNQYQISGTYTQLSYSTGESIVPDSDGIFTPSDNGTLTVTGGNATDTCVHLVWSGYRNGDYEEHWSAERSIDTSRFFPTGMKKAGDKADALYADHYDTVIGSVDLGTLSWSRYGPNSTTGDYSFGSDSISTLAAHTASNSDIGNLCTALHRAYSYSNVYSGIEGVAISPNGRLLIFDEDFNSQESTSAQFKAAMSGVMLYYELATPTTTPIDPPLNLSYKVSDFGTERIMVDETADAPQTAPVPMEVEYGLNAIDTIRRLPTSYVPREELEPKLDGKAEVDGYYASMTVGAADNLTGRGDGASGQYLYRTAGGDEDIADGIANIRSIKGQTLMWNQLAKSPTQENWTVVSNSATATFDNGDIAITATQQYGRINQTNVPFIEGHAYLMSLDYKILSAGSYSIYSSTNVQFYTVFDDAANSGTNSWRHGSQIKVVSAAQAGVSRLIIQDNRESGWDTWYVRNIQLFDLTQMFGAGNEPSTVAEFEALFPKAYYPYSEPTLLSVNMEGIETVGFNQYDPSNWVLSDNSGITVNDDGSVQVRTKSYQEEKNEYPFPNIYDGKWNIEFDLKLVSKASNESALSFVFDYTDGSNSRMRVVVGAYAVGHVEHISLTSANNKVVAGFRMGHWGYTGEILLTNLCFNMSWSGYRDGEYEEYWKSQREIPVETYFPDGMRSAGSVADELTHSKAITRVGAVDLGTLTWIYMGSSVEGLFRSEISDKAGGLLNLISEKYEKTNLGTTLMPDKSYRGQGDTNRLYFRDTSYTDGADFKSAMSGIILYYELAEPIEVVIEPPLNLSYKVSDFGTERIMVDTADPAPQSAPPVLTTVYGLNAVDTIRRLPTEYISHESFAQFCLALESALSIDITETWDATDNRYEYSITQNGGGE